jgi:hypothetical protein
LVDELRVTVKWAQKQVDPYMRYLTVAAKPALLTFQVAFGAGESVFAGLCRTAARELAISLDGSE